jgi:putative membrane protein
MSFFLSFGPTAPYPSMAFIVSLSVSNCVVSFIPGSFFGAPDPETALSALPGNRMLFQGRGLEALFLAVLGCTGSVIITAVSFPFIAWLLPLLYSSINGFIHVMLALVVSSLVFQEKRGRLLSIFMFLISGIAGYMLLSSFSSQDVLFPALSGLFGTSLMMVSISENAVVPRQKKAGGFSYSWLKGTFAGWLAGLLVGILPGIGSAQAGVISSRLLRGSEKDFLVSLGGISVSNIMFSFIALQALGKTRSGGAWALAQAVGDVGQQQVFFIVLAGSLSCFISSLITLRMGSGFLSFIRLLDYRIVNISVLSFIAVLVALFTSFSGLVILIFCTSIGVFSSLLGVKKMYLMGFLMLPTILYFSGFDAITPVLP